MQSFCVTCGAFVSPGKISLPGTSCCAAWPSRRCIRSWWRGNNCSDFLFNNHTVEPRFFEPKSPIRKTKHRGRASVATDFMLNLIAYNLIRIPKLLAA